MNIHLATDPAHIKRCAPVLRELRTFLTEDQIIDRVQQQMTDGYRLAYIEAADIVASVAGYRILRNLTYGKFLYVDDLVTRADHKRAGYAGPAVWTFAGVSRHCSWTIWRFRRRQFEPWMGSRQCWSGGLGRRI